MEKSLALVQKLLESRSGDLDSIMRTLASTLKDLEAVSGQVRVILKDSGPEAQETLKTLHRNLLATEELLEILKAKPSRVVWGSPSDKEKSEARKRVEEAHKQGEKK
jgi:hypothetical protein